MAIPDDHINTWKINYGLDRRSPEEAFRWWNDRNNGMAPAGAVAALGLCIEEIERIKAENDRAVEEALTLGISYKNKVDRLDDGCAEALRLQAEVERLRALCARQPLIERIVIDLERMVYYFRKPADECIGDPMQYACEEAEKDLALYAAGRGEGKV